MPFEPLQSATWKSVPSCQPSQRHKEFETRILRAASHGQEGERDRQRIRAHRFPKRKAAAIPSAAPCLRLDGRLRRANTFLFFFSQQSLNRCVPPLRP